VTTAEEMRRSHALMVAYGRAWTRYLEAHAAYYARYPAAQPGDGHHDGERVEAGRAAHDEALSRGVGRGAELGA
jgi:hypothetical protein